MRIGKLRFSSGFLLLCSWLLYRDQSGIVWLGLISCVLHELGHILCLSLLGSHIKEITITIFGAKIEFENYLSYVEELIVAAAGPAVNLSLALMGNFFLSPTFAGVNLALSVFNLLPVGPLDGARILYCLTAQLGNDSLSHRIDSCVTFAFTAVSGVTGVLIALYGGNLTLLFMCLWLLTGTPQNISTKFDQKEWK